MGVFPDPSIFPILISCFGCFFFWEFFFFAPSQPIAFLLITPFCSFQTNQARLSFHTIEKLLTSPKRKILLSCSPFLLAFPPPQRTHECISLVTTHFPHLTLRPSSMPSDFQAPKTPNPLCFSLRISFRGVLFLGNSSTTAFNSPFALSPAEPPLFLPSLLPPPLAPSTSRRRVKRFPPLLSFNISGNF